MNARTLSFQLVFTKDDNPELPEDLVVRRGVCVKLSPGADPDAIDWERVLRVEAEGAMRAALHRLHADGHLDA